MKQDTKETIGPRGTVAGFRPLIGEERWIFDHYTKRHIAGGCRPLLHGENGTTCGMLYPVTRKPLPPPQVETFEAHGHVWYRHVPGEVCPVEADVSVEVFLNHPTDDIRCIDKASVWDWGVGGFGYDIIGYRFPDFPAVHTPAQQGQPIVTPFVPMKAIEAADTTKQRLATMYHGWCDVAPDSVAECIADVARVLYPTDADRCEAAFQKWWGSDSDHDMHPFEAKAAWDAAWSAAKQEKL